MTSPTTQIGLLFGVTSSVYQTPLGASFGLMAAAPQVLGAELLVVADALSAVDAKRGLVFQEAVDTYRNSLVKNDLEDVRVSRDRLSEIVKGIPKQTWTKTVEEVAKIPWATQSGFLTTKLFSDFRPFSSLSKTRADKQHSSYFRNLFPFLEERGKTLVGEQRELPAILLHSDSEIASRRIQEWTALCQKCFDKIKGEHRLIPADVLSNVPLLLNYIQWLCTLLDRQSLILHHFGFPSKELEELRARTRGMEGLTLKFLGKHWEAGVAFAKVAEVEKACALLLSGGGDLVTLAQHHIQAALAFKMASEMFDATAAVGKSLEMATQSASLHGKAAVIFRGLQKWDEFIQCRNLQIKMMEGAKKRRKQLGEHEAVLEIIEENLRFTEDDPDHLQQDSGPLFWSVKEYKLTQLLDKSMTCKSLGQLEESETTLEAAGDLLIELAQHYSKEGNIQKSFEKFGLLFLVESEKESLLLKLGRVAEAVSSKILAVSLSSSMIAKFQEVSSEDPAIRKNVQSFLTQLRKKYDEVKEELEKLGHWETVKKVMEAAGISFSDDQGQLLHPVAAFFLHFEMLRNLVLGKGLKALSEEMEWFEEIVEQLNSEGDELAQEIANLGITLVGDVFTVRDSSGNTVQEIKIGDPHLLSQVRSRMEARKESPKN